MTTPAAIATTERRSSTRLSGVATGAAPARLLAFASGVATVAAMAIAVVSTHFATDTLSSPLRVDGTWEAVWVGALVAAFVAYGVGLALLSRVPVPARPVIAIGIAIQLIPLFAPLLLSRDTYAYWAYGRLPVVHNLNPFVDAPDAVSADPAVALMGGDWIEAPTVYGPAFVAVSEGVARIAGADASVATLAFRGLAAAAVVVLVLLASRIGRNPAFSAAFVGWSPLLALHFAGGGHNAALMMVLVLAALALAAADRFVAAGAAWALAAALQWLPLLFFGLWLLALRGRRVAEAAVGFVVTAVVAATLASVMYGSGWLRAFASARDDAFWATSLSLPFQLDRVGVPRRFAVAAFAVAFVIALFLLALAAWRRKSAPLARTALVASLSTSWLVPWYGVWSTSLAAVEEDRLARIAAFALAGYLLTDALPG